MTEPMPTRAPDPNDPMPDDDAHSPEEVEHDVPHDDPEPEPKTGDTGPDADDGDNDG
jgi:hypothetical protein